METARPCLELAGAPYPVEVNGLAASPPEGRSLLPLLRKEISATHDTLFWEHEGGRALRVGNWKISALDQKAWELFNLAVDRTETHDLAARMPEKVKDMEAVWQEIYARLQR